MKIIWENVCRLKYSKRTGRFHIGKMSFVEMESCKECGESYLTNAYRPGDFCSGSCSKKRRNNPNYGKKCSKETKRKIGIKNSKENNVFWKGGYNKRNIPLYDTYAHQIEYCEEVRRNPEDENILQVKCTYCDKWHIPKINEVRNRIKVLNGKQQGEARFYCSDKCKRKCPIYHKISYQEDHPNKPRKIDLSKWSKIIKEKANYKCEICSSVIDLNSHHILPIKTHPDLQMEIDNGVCLCKKCHMKYGHEENTECSISSLRNIWR